MKEEAYYETKRGRQNRFQKVLSLFIERQTRLRFIMPSGASTWPPHFLAFMEVNVAGIVADRFARETRKLKRSSPIGNPLKPEICS